MVHDNDVYVEDTVDRLYDIIDSKDSEIEMLTQANIKYNEQISYIADRFIGMRVNDLTRLEHDIFIELRKGNVLVLDKNKQICWKKG